MGKEIQVTLAQHIQPSITIFGDRQAIFWAAAVAHEAYAAFPALVRQISFFIPPKLALLRQVD